MANPNLKKATFFLADLPGGTLNPDNTVGYYVRFRLASDDKNRKSQWSPIFFVTTEDVDIPVYFDAGGL